MNSAESKFNIYAEAGEITNGAPLPMKFTFRELESLFFGGLIYEANNMFIAVVE